ncbi:MAG: hypothetical protein ACNS61_04840 [Candidatus Wenzhouxiangella sp. M2_3B_020]
MNSHDTRPCRFVRGVIAAGGLAACWLAVLSAVPVVANASRTLDLRAAGVELVVSLDDELRADANGEPWRQWLRTGIAAAHTVTGGFPRDRVLVDLRATSRGSSSVAFGQIRRSRPPRVRFWVSPTATLAELNADWRSYHEFAHLLIPFPGNRDIWFTEGLASYYQYLLQSRADLIPSEQAWRQLLAGFERGVRDRAGRGRTLRSLSPDMWRERAFKRVYWTGAAFFLRVDVRLRTESGGRHSLDRALAAFHRCCIDDDRDWSARALIDTLGHHSVERIWRQEYRATIDRVAVPRAAAALDLLGIRAEGDRVVFGQRPDQFALRRAIAGSRPAAFQDPAASAP